MKIKKIMLAIYSISILFASYSLYSMKREKTIEEVQKEAIKEFTRKLQLTKQHIETINRQIQDANKKKNLANEKYTTYFNALQEYKEQLDKIDIKEQRNLWEEITNKISQANLGLQKWEKELHFWEGELRNKQDQLDELEKKEGKIKEELEFYEENIKEYEMI